MRLFAAHIMHYYFMDFDLVLCVVLNRVIVALDRGVRYMIRPKD
jgi:hypothetical protein